MSFFDDLKTFAKDALDSLTAGSPAIMRVCMMGARGVGKTSVLTSMFSNLNKASENENLQLLTADNPESGINLTENELLNKLAELKEMYNCTDPDGLITSGGIEASAEVRSYDFSFGIKGKRPCIHLQVKDFPGEYISSRPDEVGRYIDESNAVIIAIDSVYLMECSGMYNDTVNRPSEITSFFKSTFANLDEDKLVLLVPLKCEKYFAENRTDELLDAVENCYKELIDFFGSSRLKSKVACAVTPILTTGTVVFKKFKTDDGGNVIMLKNRPVPAKAYYSLLTPDAVYSPEYCEQPLYYLLSFIVKLYSRSKNSVQNKNFLQKLAALFKLFPDDPTLLLEISKAAKRKITEGNGYKIIQGSAVM